MLIDLAGSLRLMSLFLSLALSFSPSISNDRRSFQQNKKKYKDRLDGLIHACFSVKLEGLSLIEDPTLTDKRFLSPFWPHRRDPALPAEMDLHGREPRRQSLPAAGGMSREAPSSQQ